MRPTRLLGLLAQTTDVGEQGSDTFCTFPERSGRGGHLQRRDLLLADELGITGGPLLGTYTQELVYVRCLDPDCATFHSNTVNPTGVDAYSMALGPDGLARIAYHTGSSEVGFIHCADDDCGAFTDTFLAYTWDNGVVSIATGTDGTSYIVYDDFDPARQESGIQGLGLATCSGGGCATAHIADVSIYSSIGAAITMGADGNPVVVYDDSGNTADPAPDSIHYYTNGTNTVVSSEGDGALYNVDVALGPDGFARIVFPRLQPNHGDADLIQCLDAFCAAKTVSVIQFSGSYLQAASLAVDTDGNTTIQGGSGYVDYVSCAASGCSTYSDQLVPGGWTNTSFVSLTLGPDGIGRMVALMSGGTVAHIRPRLSAAVTLNSDGQVALGDGSALLYQGTVGTLDLGLMAGMLGNVNGCFAGNEVVGAVRPSTATGPVTIKRLITSLACYVGSSQTDCGAGPGDDTGTWITTDPQNVTPRGSASGHVYNLDLPGLMDLAGNGTFRMRVNFKAYAVAEDGTTRISPNLNYYVRLSCRLNSSGVAEFSSDASFLDNKIGLGTTSTTWDLK